MCIVRYLAVALLLASTPVAAQGPKPTAQPLPRVLIIGDSTYSQHTRELTKLLKGQVDITYALWQPHEIADTTTTLQTLDRHLGRISKNGEPVEPAKWPQWDLIHVNCGLGDLIHRAPGMQSFRVMPIHVGGIRNTPVDRYTKNLETLIKTLKAKAAGARIIWASTTPIRASASGVFAMGSEIQYNQAAAQVMQQHDVPINDMHTFTKHLINMDKPAGFGADPFHFDKKPLHMPIVRVIERAFQLPPMAVTEEETISQQNAAQAANLGKADASQ